jgi:ArsR family transcriptional regulator, arsenate/arsenite/antimonite-responsive transcriptional repressor
MATSKKPGCITDADAAVMLAALGSGPRLAVYRQILRAGPTGLTISRVQELSGIPPSTLKHHLTTLTGASLVEQEKLGREVYCRTRIDVVRALSDFLLRECCQASPSSPPARRASTTRS